MLIKKIIERVGCMPKFLNKIFAVVFLFQLANFTCINAASTGPFGTEAAVSIVYPFGLTQAGNATNFIKAFGYARPGFSLTDSATTCTWQSVFPVAGPISLNNGTVYLGSDLILTNTGAFNGPGYVWGCNHALEFSQSTNTLSLGSGSAQGTTLSLISRVSTPGGETVNSIDWSYDSSYVAIATTTAATNNLYIYSFDGTNLTYKTGTATTGTSNCVRWHPSAYYLAIVNNQTSNQLKIYQYTPGTNTLAQVGSSASPYAVSVTGVSWRSGGGHVAVTPSSGTTVTVYPFTGSALGTAVTGALGATKTFSGNCIRWAPNAPYFAVGSNANASTELNVFYFSTTLTLTASAEIGQTVNCLDWSQTGTNIAVGLAGGSTRITVFAHKVYNGTLTSAATVAEATASVTSVGWNYDGTKLAVGLAVSTSSEFRSYTFNKTTPALTLDVGIDSSFDINVVRYNRASTYIARANNQTTNNLAVYQPLSAAYFCKDANLFFNSDVAVQSPIGFSGLCSLNGRGNTLAFSGNGNIDVKPGSYLTIKNATLKCQKSGVFSLESRSSRIKFEDSTLWLDSDLTIGDGSFEVFGDMVITGTHTLTYSSAYTSTIDSFSSLHLEDGAGLRVGKTTTREPLEFSSRTSKLILDNSTLYVNNNGNVTFDAPMWEYSPWALSTNIGRAIIAPFFADVDTWGYDPLDPNNNSKQVTYGTGTVNGYPAFGVNWVDVGYYSSHVDKLNSFQLILIDRSDRGVGDFDMEFNYNKIEWETGDVTGDNGFGGNSARAGFSNGSGERGTYYEFPGSGVHGAFLDRNLETGLIYHSRNRCND